MLRSLLVALSLAITIAAQEMPKRITTASAVRLRAQPSTGSAVVETLSIGTVLDASTRSATRERVGAQEDFWYRVKTPNGKQGWIFGALTREIAPSALDDAYLEIARERLASEQRTFSDWTDFVLFLERVSPSVADRETRAQLELARLHALGRSFREIPYGGLEKPPYEPWIVSHREHMVYSEPGGIWLIDSDAFWALHNRYKDTAVAERLAWAAAENSLPGECEGDIACNLEIHALTNGRYLTLYPKGAHAGEAIAQIGETLKFLLEDLKGERHVVDIPTEPEYRADLFSVLEKLRKMVAPIDDPLARRVVGQLDEIRKMSSQ